MAYLPKRQIKSGTSRKPGGFFLFLGMSLSTAYEDEPKTNPLYLIGGMVILTGGIYGAVKEPNLNKGYKVNKK